MGSLGELGWARVGDTAAWSGACLLPDLGPGCHDRPLDVTRVDQCPVHRNCSKTLTSLEEGERDEGIGKEGARRMGRTESDWGTEWTSLPEGVDT